MDTVTSVSHLHKRYGNVVAVDDVTFDVRRGEIFGLLGPNGAGKTTTVECAQGLRPRSGGMVTVLGCDPVTQHAELLGRVGCQLQSSALPDRLHVQEAIELFSKVHRDPSDVDTVLESWDLTSLRRRPFAALSGGQRQRLFLALALLGNPEVVFLDELTTGLDPHARRSTWELVRQVRQRGATVVLVTHFMEEAEALCDRVAIVNEGRIVTQGSPAELVAGSGQDVRVTFTTPPQDLRFLTTVAGVTSVANGGPLTTVMAHASAVVPLAATLADHDVAPPDFQTHHPTLEQIFLATTGRSLAE